MNILFANYGDFTSNSLNHIGGFANTLSAQGHACVVAVPSGKATVAKALNPVYIPATFDEVLAQPGFFPDRGTADVIHAWTPRECVRKFVLNYQRTARRAARLLVHLEDNEAHLIEGYARRSEADLGSMGFADLDALMTDSLPHPFRHRTFLRLADQVTVIVERLGEKVPAGVPWSLLEPGVDPLYLEAAPADERLRVELGLASSERIVVFTGSNTFANEPEMRDLYVAIRILNSRGVPTRLVRTGFNRPEFLESLSPDLRAHVLDLGFIDKARLPALLALADVLVQPGRPGPFNDYRLPSKLPEFLSSGRPVILPPTNIALLMQDAREALFLSSGSPEDIADRCQRVFSDPALAKRMGERGAAFAAKRFNLAANTERLLATYAQALARPPRPHWEHLRETRTSDLTAAAREVARALEQANPGARPADLAALAGDVAHVVRLEDERACAAEAARDKVRLALEEALRHAELQRDLTSQHARNLEEKVQSQDRLLKLQKKLSDRHIVNLEARISGIEAVARAKQDKVSAQLSEASAEHRKLVARILEMDAEMKSREQRLKAIFRSASWRLTAPLRDLEKLAQRLRSRFGGAAAVDAGGAAGAASSVQLPLEAQAAPGQPEPPAPGAPPARHYTFNIDHPRTWTTASNKLLILGWCYENDGAPIRGFRAHFAGRTFEGIYGSKRLDVLVSTGKKQAEYCGIKVDVATVLGDHILVLEVRHDEGWQAFFQTMVHVGKAGDPAQLTEYEKWCEQHERLEDEDRAAIDRHIEAIRADLFISVVMPVYNPPEELLEKAIESVQRQLYPRWELCIADDASSEPHVRRILDGHAARDPRIKVTYRQTNGHICEASNSALALASCPYVALFDHDDVLHPRALYEVAAELDAHPDARLVYTDEDKIDMEDRRFDPYFKPDWNPDLNTGQNYVSHLSVYSTELVRSLGGFRNGFEGSQDWDLLLRAVETIPSSAIRHIPKVLYHWRAAPGSTALQLAEKNYPAQAARAALEDHFRRLGTAVEILPVAGDHWRVKYAPPSPPPLASLIIPTRNAVKLLRRAVDSITAHTVYPNYEVIIVDNQSDDPDTLAYLEEIRGGADRRLRIVPYMAPFNYSAINNAAVAQARGEVIVFLNNDVEAIDAAWLNELVSQACRAGIGAVGAMLYYPLNTVQHAGVILGLGGVAGHPFKEFPRGDQGQMNRLRLVQNYSAVTAACLAIRKDRFLEVGGFNERALPVAFNDVDLCCKLLRAGYRNLWTPFAELYHHESATRGVEDTPEKKARFQSEIDYMMDTWGELLMADPAYNPNLTLVGEDFSLAYLSRTSKSWMAHLT